MASLVVWMNGIRIGEWNVGATGYHRFDYDPSWLLNPRARPLSLSLPMTGGGLSGAVVANFFDNLLPDSESIRKRISTRRQLKGTDAFTLLESIGRDCVGAVQLLPPGVEPSGFDAVNYQLLSNAAIEKLIASLGASIGHGHHAVADDIRLSIAGAQEKTALLLVNGKWAQPLGATPTTHILKPPIGVVPNTLLDMRLSVENEWLCNQIVHALKLDAAHCRMEDFGARRVLVVERFDREWTREGWIARLPQEDLCQVMGVPGRQKYENDGGPGMQACLQKLRGGADFQHDGTVFLQAQLLFWFLAAIDGHAKNFSVFLLPKGTYRLTPLYDVLSAWPVIGKKAHQIPYQNAKLAMAVRGQSSHYSLATIQRRHWEQLARTSGVDHAWDAMLDLAQRLPAALQAVRAQLPKDFPSGLMDQISDGALKHLARFNQPGPTR